MSRATARPLPERTAFPADEPAAVRRGRGAHTAAVTR